MIEGTEYLKIKKSRRPEASIMTSVRLSPEFYDLVKEHKIMISEALRVGIAILLAENGVMEYDNRLNVYRKMLYFQKLAEESSAKAFELEKLLKGGDKEKS